MTASGTAVKENFSVFREAMRKALLWKRSTKFLRNTKLPETALSVKASLHEELLDSYDAMTRYHRAIRDEEPLERVAELFGFDPADIPGSPSNVTALDPKARAS